MDDDLERQRLNDVARRYDPSDPSSEFDFHMKRLLHGVITPLMLGTRVLEMGCATGRLTSLMSLGRSVYEVVEGSSYNCQIVAAEFPGMLVHHELWETFEPSDLYSDILLVCALEHVVDPVVVLRRAYDWLEPNGRIHIVVPNSESLHRYVGVEMGILASRTELSTSDHRIGHRRVYDMDELATDIGAAGFELLHWQGVLLKVVSNAQMLDWDFELIAALQAVGERFPRNCAELYACASRPS